MDDFFRDLELNDVEVGEFLDEFRIEVIELFETSSAEVSIFGKKYLFEITAKEIK